jgi:phage baseplate assembly protein W
MPLEDSYLGRGWSFPPSFQAPALLPANRPNTIRYEVGGVDMVAGQTDIEQSLHILLTTRLGERVLAPDFGCDLHPLVFEPLNAATAARFEDLVLTAVLYHEPRIELLDVTATQPPEETGLVLLDLHYQVRSTNSRHNYVYPFYLQEGSELGLLAGAGALALPPDGQ